ncbi:capsular polysaccharide transport system permease protein [Shimia aestuarii]|uniref:Transport permease protein n=2 Tax=Shimia aestuarii TaxID=254406 RepID=A0A1I4TI06_9RHOB|nr:capsular polysaccharide transport system permease protein [Shimia aestuarii]
MSTRYGRTPGGYIWAVLEPLGAIMILSIGFSLLLRSPSLGNSFLLFYASGYLVLSLYQNVSVLVARALAFSKPLLIYPSVSWLDAILARFFLNTLTNALVAYLLLTLIIMLIETRIIFDAGPMVVAMGLTAFIGLAIGTLNCALFGLFPAWEAVWSIATRPLFLASGIFYTYEDLPTLAQDILWWNPLLHLTGLIRTGLYTNYRPDYLNLTYVLSIAVVVLCLGLLLLRRHHKTILNN